MFSMFSRKPAEKKPADEGPHFLQGSYPSGFQPLYPESSLRNALTVVTNIAGALGDQIPAEPPGSLTESELKSWLDDHAQCMSIHTKINLLIAEIEILSNSSMADILQNQEATMEKVVNIVRAAARTSEGLVPGGPQSLIACNALADVLHITRRSIPPIEALNDYKVQIRLVRADVLETKSVTEFNMSQRAIAKIKTGTTAVRDATREREIGAGASDNSVDDVEVDNSHGLK